MPSFSHIRNIFLTELEKNKLKTFTLQQLVRHNLPRDYNMSTIEIHVVNNEIIECEDRNIYCDLCLSRRNSPRLDISNVQLYEYTVAYITLKQTIKPVKDILTEPVPYLLNNTEIKEYIEKYLLGDRITGYIITIIKNINSIRSVYGKEPIQNVTTENLNDVSKMYLEEFKDKPMVLFTDMYDITVNNTDDTFIMSRTGDIDTTKCLIITHKPQCLYRVNKFILDLFREPKRLIDFKKLQVPALTEEQLSLLNIYPDTCDYYNRFMKEFNHILHSMTCL